MIEDEKALMSKVPYTSTADSLMYAMVYSRSDIAKVGVFSRYMRNLRQEQWRAAKWILRYLKESSEMALCYEGTDIRLHEYIDSDFAGDIDNWRSTTGYVFTLDSGVISWS